MWIIIKIKRSVEKSFSIQLLSKPWIDYRSMSKYNGINSDFHSHLQLKSSKVIDNNSSSWVKYDSKQSSIYTEEDAKLVNDFNTLMCHRLFFVQHNFIVLNELFLSKSSLLRFTVCPPSASPAYIMGRFFFAGCRVAWFGRFGLHICQG